MNLIVLSLMYPKRYTPNSGTFVDEQVQALKKLTGDEIAVIAPVPWSPRFLWFRKRWREYGQTERTKIKNGIRAYHPRYLVIPGTRFFPLQSFFMYLSVKSLTKKLAGSNRGEIVLHTHAILPAGFAGVLLGRKFNIPHICTIHGSDINIYPFQTKLCLLFTKYTLRRCDKMVAVSDKLRKRMLSVVKGLNDISIIYNGADSDKFKPMPKEIAKRALGIDETNKIIMFIGNLIPVKGVNYLLEAFAQFMKDYRIADAALYIIGDGREREYLTSLAGSLDIKEKVFFLGRKPHVEIPLWLNIADILVLPSISEGFPTIIPEAMMSGVPIVASNVGGISEIITSGETGILTEPGDIEHITKGIKFLLDDSMTRKKIIISAMEKSQKYTWENNALEYMKVYGKLLDDYKKYN